MSGHFHHVGPASAPVSQGLIAVASEASGKVHAALPYAGVVYTTDAASGEYTSFATRGFLQYPRALPILPGGDVIVADNARDDDARAHVGASRRRARRQPGLHAVRRARGEAPRVPVGSGPAARDAGCPDGADRHRGGGRRHDRGGGRVRDPGRQLLRPVRVRLLRPVLPHRPGPGATTPLLPQNGEWRLGGIAIYRGPSVITPVRTPTWGSLKARYR